MSGIQESFHDIRLTNYCFSVCESEHIDECGTGYDEQGQEWKGTSLLSLREQGRIIKEFLEKTVFLRDKALLGHIRECPDGTWLAHSCYFLEGMDYVEVYGFRNELYAIRYLHEIIVKTFPTDVYPSLPSSEWDISQPLLQVKKYVYLQSLDAQLGYIQRLEDSFWIAYSFYSSENMLGLKAIGFSSEFYATRYLFQIAAVYFPDLIEEEEIPELSWI